jgi:hypothetical protein
VNPVLDRNLPVKIKSPFFYILKKKNVMNVFKLPVFEDRPLTITDFKIDLQSSSAPVFERYLNTTEKYLFSSNDSSFIIYKDALLDEGYLNMYLCQFKTGKYVLHIFGRINNLDFKTEKFFDPECVDSTMSLPERIRYVLTQGVNMLQRLYKESSLKELEEGLLNTILK